MSSNINPNNVVGTFPIAGQNNDSQGFRSNFTNIKTNLSYAKTEIEDLQGKVVVKSALSGTTVDNNMAGTGFSGALVKDIREVRVDFGTDSGSFTLNFANGHNYTLTTNGNATVAFSGFPAAGQVGRLRFEITVASASHTLTFPSAVSKGTSGISGLSTANVITFTEAGTYQFEFWTDDGGTTIHVEDLSRPRDVFHSSEIQLVTRTPANTGQSGDVAGMIALDGSYMYICTGTYDGSTVIWKRASFSAY